MLIDTEKMKYLLNNMCKYLFRIVMYPYPSQDMQYIACIKSIAIHIQLTFSPGEADENVQGVSQRYRKYFFCLFSREAQSFLLSVFIWV